jgi:hypothetical protein
MNCGTQWNGNLIALCPTCFPTVRVKSLKEIEQKAIEMATNCADDLQELNRYKSVCMQMAEFLNNTQYPIINQDKNGVNLYTNE